jgi:hypothetical protein
MKIEAGKIYVDGTGGIYGPLTRCPPGHRHKADMWYHEASDMSWRENGVYNPESSENTLDLVAEYVEPAFTFTNEPGYPHPSGDVRFDTIEPSSGAELRERATNERDAYGVAAADALAEVRRAKELWPNPANSMHEQFAVMWEEFDELKAHVWMNQKKRDLAAARKEAIQVAAMALRFAAECCDETVGRK